MGPWPWQLLRSRRPQAPTLTLRPILGTATTATGHTGEATTDPTAAMATGPTAMATMATDTMATTERGLLMPLPSLAPTLMLRLTLGTDTTATATGHMAMDITGTGHTGTHTGDKKWSSTTTSDLFLPTHL